MPRVSLYQKHKAKWSNCTDCELCKTRDKTVLFKGNIPCEILFIGEHPGASEDTLGKPFSGPAGNLLHEMIEEAIAHVYTEGEEYPTIGYTNLIACIPKNEEGVKISKTPKKSIKACEDRLKELITLCKPRHIVRVGKRLEKYIVTNQERAYSTIVHPAAILGADVTQKGLMYQRTLLTLVDVFEEEQVPF